MSYYSHSKLQRTLTNMKKREQVHKTVHYYAVAAYLRLTNQDIPPLKVSEPKAKKPSKKAKKRALKIKFAFDNADEKQSKTTGNGIYIGGFPDDVRESAREAAKGVLEEYQGCDSGDIGWVIQQAKAAAEAAAGVTPKPAKTKPTKRKQTAAKSGGHSSNPEAGNKRQRAISGKKMPPPMLAPPAIETSGKKKPPPKLPPPKLAQPHAAVASGKKKPSTILHAV